MDDRVLVYFSPVMHFIETNQLIYKANQMTGFYMKRNTRLNWVIYVSELLQII